MTSGHYENFRENMFFDPAHDENRFALKPMNCPGHMLLFGEQAAELPRAADPLRRVVDRSTATSSAGRCTGSCA